MVNGDIHQESTHSDCIQVQANLNVDPETGLAGSNHDVNSKRRFRN